MYSLLFVLHFNKYNNFHTTHMFPSKYSSCAIGQTSKCSIRLVQSFGTR